MLQHCLSFSPAHQVTMEDMSELPEASLSPYFRGVARVQLSALNFSRALSSQRHRPLSEKIVTRLVDVLRREGCRRDDEANFVDVVVDDDALQAALAKVGLTDASLQSGSESQPILPLHDLQCLHGLHRIAAARLVLDQNDQWWPVRLYSGTSTRTIDGVDTNAVPGLPEDLSIKIIEGNINEQPYADGVVLRKILLYRREGSKSLENKWWARLSTSKQKDLKQLLSKSLFVNALNDLLDMPGLWYPIKLGALHRLLTLRCDEVYLSRCSSCKKLILYRSYYGTSAISVLSGLLSSSVVRIRHLQKSLIARPSKSSTC